MTYTIEGLAEKVDYEGGLASALEYGIKVDEVPEEIRPLWREAKAAYEAFADVARPLNAILDEVALLGWEREFEL